MEGGREDVHYTFLQMVKPEQDLSVTALELRFCMVFQVGALQSAFVVCGAQSHQSELLIRQRAGAWMLCLPLLAYSHRQICKRRWVSSALKLPYLVKYVRTSVPWHFSNTLTFAGVRDIKKPTLESLDVRALPCGLKSVRIFHRVFCAERGSGKL